MSGIKYQVRNHVAPTIAPLTAAIGLALGAGSLQAATITVTTLSDGSVPGECTLRDAVISANTNSAAASCSAGSGTDQIVFAGGLTGTISLAYGQLPIASDMTITGPGVAQLTISGGNSSRVFFADGPLTLEIRSLRLSDGYANDNAGGAGLVAANGSTVTLADCEISNNNSGPISYGGAITASNASVTVNNCQIIGNTVAGGAAPRGANNAFGGGVLAVNSQLEITNSDFQNNSADAYGGAMALVNSTATIDSSGFVLNNALIGGGLSLGGGSQLTLQNSFVSGNQAGGGGGIAIGSLSSATVNATDLSGNDAIYFGGGAMVGVGFAGPTPLSESGRSGSLLGTPDFSLIGPGELNVINGYIGYNQTEDIGGGIGAKYDSLVGITNSDVVYNLADPAPVLPRSEPGRLVERGGSAQAGRGGGLAAVEGAYIYADQVSLSSNTAVYGGGGFADQAGSILMGNSVISNNSASGIGGGLLGGSFPPPVVPRLDGNTRGGRGAYDGAVGAVYSLISGNQGSYGGGIASLSDGLAVVKYSIVENNSSSDYGGGVLAYSSSLLVAGSDIRSNESYRGGGIFSQTGATGGSVIAGSTISGNTADLVGGAFLQGPNQQLKYSTIDGNSAAVAGGLAAFGQPGAEAEVFNSTVTNNTAEIAGGLYVGYAALDFLTVSHNTATGTPAPRHGWPALQGAGDNPGGGFLFNGSAVTSSIFADNTSPAGVVDLVGGGPATLDHSLVETPGTGVPPGTGNLIGVDPQLGILAANGGPTTTRAIGPGSPALDAANPVTARENDQRGEPFPRVFNGRADMGAFEFFVDGVFADRFEQP
jgi:hypothetical protein